MRGYLIGRCPAVKCLLDRAESQNTTGAKQDNQEPITMDETRDVATRYLLDVHEDTVVLSGHVWLFWNLCCQSGGSTVFNSLRPELNGLEAWRALTWEIHNGKHSRLGALRRHVHESPQVKTYAAVSGAIADLSGGRRASDSRQ